MPTTANIDMPYPDESSDASLNVHIAALAGAIDGRIGPYVLDTGWVNVTPMGGFVGTIMYRRVGKVVEVSATGTAAFPNGSGLTIGNIPAAVRPSGTRRGACWLTGSNVGTIGTTATGNIDINHASGATRNNVQASLIYMVN